MRKILLVEDDVQLGEVVSAFLEANNYLVDHCSLAADCFVKIKQTTYDCIILDLTLPDEDGLVVLRKLQKSVETPVIICSARAEASDRIAGLELGARDYISKPFSSKELILRIDNILKHRANTEPQNQTLQIGNNVLDITNKTFHEAGDSDKVISLTQNEYNLLTTLANHPGKVYSRNELIDAILGIEGPESQRAIDIIVSRLRKKIEIDSKHPQHVVTVVGFGYRLCC